MPDEAEDSTPAPLCRPSAAALWGGAVLYVCRGTVPDCPLASCASIKMRRCRDINVEARLRWKRDIANLNGRAARSPHFGCRVADGLAHNPFTDKHLRPHCLLAC